MTRAAEITRSRDPKGNGRTFQPVQRYELDQPSRVCNYSQPGGSYTTPKAFYRNDGLKAIKSKGTPT